VGRAFVPVPLLFFHVNKQSLEGFTSEKDQAAANAEGNGFGAAGGAELAEDGGDVKLDGVLRDVQLCGDFLVAKATGEHLENFALARGEWLSEFAQTTRW
jgi:hypothetical protein